MQPREVARRATLKILVRMTRHAADAQDHPAMLESIIGIVELGPHATDPWPADLTHHLIQPVTADRLDIVIDQPQDIAAGIQRTVVVDRRVVEAHSSAAP